MTIINGLPRVNPNISSGSPFGNPLDTRGKPRGINIERD
ncbi:MAG: hypothetical protein US63_C0035G0002 [Candidatus Moranbacteria bacterium GW2011_GWC2_37_8]|nr:MAG: hypothetical protein US63_C0035G0002 [Candidatus Moranbacteria bacterium GW2011_GWC2_37_8]KKQ61872.1 MAG: hypothetical protein US82_C0019G0010 [Parcubacteria group bacterium GW2011_GWC1_38_22]KKQ81366.1 MAG: hypothetical protein UT03_C0004G0005 [Candidatus Moranbacteria bacterium GW2011_GWD2_38_7]